MSIKLTNTLVFRSALSVLIASTILTIIASFFFYRYTYTNEIKEGKERIDQLAATVEQSSAIASYLVNSELALEVVHGVAKNSIVQWAAIIGESGFIESSGEKSSATQSESIEYVLSSPFLAEEKVGALVIVPNTALIEQNAKRIALIHSIILTLYAVIILCLISAIIHLRITHPLVQLIAAVNTTQPGEDTELSFYPINKNNEIGQLVENSNYLLTSIYDTLEREKRLREEIQKMERRFRLLFEEASAGIALISPLGQVVTCNKSFKQLTGASSLDTASSAKPVSFASLFLDEEVMQDSLNMVLTGTKVTAGDYRFKDSVSGTPRLFHCLLSRVVEAGDQLFVEVIMYDISERALREKKYRIEVEYDPLTALYNRRAGKRRITELLKRTAELNHQCAFILVDLDRFKPVNDEFGHEVGDLVLVEIANRLTGSVRKDDIVVRWGGDEFLIVLQQGHGSLQVDPVADSLLTSLATPIHIGKLRSVTVGASLGIAFFPNHGSRLEELVYCADRAMYQVKERGRNGYCIFNSEIVR